MGPGCPLVPPVSLSSLREGEGGPTNPSACTEPKDFPTQGACRLVCLCFFSPTLPPPPRGVCGRGREAPGGPRGGITCQVSESSVRGVFR